MAQNKKSALPPGATLGDTSEDNIIFRSMYKGYCAAVTNYRSMRDRGSFSTGWRRFKTGLGFVWNGVYFVGSTVVTVGSTIGSAVSKSELFSSSADKLPHGSARTKKSRFRRVVSSTYRCTKYYVKGIYKLYKENQIRERKFRASYDVARDLEDETVIFSTNTSDDCTSEVTEHMPMSDEDEDEYPKIEENVVIPSAVIQPDKINTEYELGKKVALACEKLDRIEAAFANHHKQLTQNTSAVLAPSSEGDTANESLTKSVPNSPRQLRRPPAPIPRAAPRGRNEDQENHKESKIPVRPKSLDRRLHTPPVEANVKVLPYPSARPSDVVADEYYTEYSDDMTYTLVSTYTEVTVTASDNSDEEAPNVPPPDYI